jgi:hypothetical protein
VTWGDSHLDSSCTICIIHRDNHASFRVAEKLGYHAALRAATENESDSILVRQRTPKLDRGFGRA